MINKIKKVSDVDVESVLNQLKLPEMRKTAAKDNVDYALHAVPLKYPQAKVLIKWKRNN